MIPTVVPLSGSAATSGIGMKGAVAGLNQRETLAPNFEEGGLTTDCGAFAGAGGACGGFTAGTCATTERPNVKARSASSAVAARARAHFSSSAQHSSSLSMSAAETSPMVEIRNSFCDRFPWPA